MHADRRFALDPSFILIMMDILEKHMIHSYQRRVVVAWTRETMTAADVRVYDHERQCYMMNERVTSAIPHTVRCLYAYKKKEIFRFEVHV